MGVANGLVPKRWLRKVRRQPSMRLRKYPERSYARVQAEVKKKHGWMPRLNDAYRSRWRQVKILKQNYDNKWRPGLSFANGGIRHYMGRTWYRKPGKASAATPGYSIHGDGRAIDVDDLGGFDTPRYNQFKAAAGKNGWNNKRGREIGEWWHWEYVPKDDKVRYPR